MLLLQQMSPQINYYSTCTNGAMNCEATQETDKCENPQVYLDCSSLPKGSTGVACLPTCQDPKPFCKSTTEHCESGCACPEGTVRGRLVAIVISRVE